jgi:transposase
MVRRRKTYTREFKLEAVRLAHESDKSVLQIAKELGIHSTMLGRWIKEFDQDPEQSFPGKGHLKDSDEEVRRLRRELDRVTQERDILKKAVAIFSKEPK